MRSIIFTSLAVLALAGCEPPPSETGLPTQLQNDAPAKVLVEAVADELTRAAKTDPDTPLLSARADGSILRTVVLVEGDSRVIPPERREEFTQYVGQLLVQKLCDRPSGEVFFGVGAKMDVTIVDSARRVASRFVIDRCSG